RVLHTIAELREDSRGDIQRVLAHEEDADPFAPDERHALFDFLLQGCGDIGKEEVRFVEEEDELRLFQIPYFGQALVKFAEQPKEHRRISTRALHEALGCENVDLATA